MQSISTIGLDIAKSVFQVHGVDAAGQVVIRRQLRRRLVLAFFQKLPPCLVGIEACERQPKPAESVENDPTATRPRSARSARAHYLWN
jgi:transposase